MDNLWLTHLFFNQLSSILWLFLSLRSSENKIRFACRVLSNLFIINGLSAN